MRSSGCGRLRRIPHGAALAAALAAAAAASPAAARASEGAQIGPAPERYCLPLDCGALGASGRWRHVTFPGRAPNRFSCDGGALRVRSEGSVSLLAAEAPEAFATARALTWEWAVREGAAPRPLDRAGADDRSLVVLVAYRYESATARFSERLRRPFARAIAGRAAPARAVAYTWGGLGPAGATLDSPRDGGAHKIRILQPADPARETGVFRPARAALAADHAALFDRPGRIQHIAIGADTDDGGGGVDASVRRLCLER
ncbi:MAG: DUF3047 domain-containing protein [Pseudomonadota bacterium]